MSYAFKYNTKLGISLPVLNKQWENYLPEEQDQILKEWEAYRSNIPQRIKDIERIIEDKQFQLNDEDNFQRSCQLNNEISQLASTINDLHIWFRIQQETQRKVHQ